jgi:hypothetical protein
MTQKEKVFNYLTIRGYEKKWMEVYTEIRKELIELGVEDASRVTNMSYHLMSLRSKSEELILKMKNEIKFFGFDTETDLISIITDFIREKSEEIEIKYPLKGDL